GSQRDNTRVGKGVASGVAPVGGRMVSDALMEPFGAGHADISGFQSPRHAGHPEGPGPSGTATFLHGVTFAGHPVSAAVALANLDVFEKEDLLANVRANEGGFRATLEKLRDLPIVGDVRGDGYFYGIELVKDRATRETFNDEESECLRAAFLSPALFEAGP